MGFYVPSPCFKLLVSELVDNPAITTHDASDPVTSASEPNKDAVDSVARSTSIRSTSGTVPQIQTGVEGSATALSSTGSMNKPVAMVQPRKVHGVRVLPTAAGQQLNGRATRVSRSPAIRQVRPYRQQQQQRDTSGTASVSSSSTLSSKVATTGKKHVPPPPPPPSIKRWKPVETQIRKDRKRTASIDGGDVGGNGGGDDDEDDSDNWQCRRYQAGCQSLSSGGRSGSRSGNGSCSSRRSRSRLHGSGRMELWPSSRATQHEALLVGQKKDAEIAALLHHIRLEGKTKAKVKVSASRKSRDRLVNATVCSMTSNLEQSLGYFP